MKWRVPHALLRVRDEGVAFTAWWWGELRELSGLLLRHLPSRQAPMTFLRVRADSLSLERRVGDQWKVDAEAPIAHGALPTELPSLPAELAGSRTAIILEDSELLFCSFELPLAAERQLSTVLRLQLERALPLAIDQVLFDRQVTARDRAREVLCVRAAVAHRERVEALRELATRWGLVPVGAGPAVDGQLTFNLLVRRRDPLRWRPSPLDRRLLQAVAAGVAALLLVLGVQWWRERSLVDEQAAELHAQAARIAGDRAGLVRESGPLLALQGIVATRDAAAVLAKLSQSMPQGAWFNHVEIVAHARQTGKIRLIGAVASREEAIAALRGLGGVGKLDTSTVFNGQILGPENVELAAEFDAAAGKAGT